MEASIDDVTTDAPFGAANTPNTIPSSTGADTDHKAMLRASQSLAYSFVDKPLAQDILNKCAGADNVLGLAGAYKPKGDLIAFVESEKKQLIQNDEVFRETVNTNNPRHSVVMLVRVGDFYETWGYDAVLLIELAGLSPMGGKPKAG